jgi:peptide/nickel transport system permease protein
VGRYLLRRAAFAVLLVFTVSSAALLLTTVAPGDFVTATSDPGMSREVQEAMRARYGLNRSAAEIYRSWLARAVRLDFGRSLAYNTPVAALVRERAANTSILALTALALATFVGIPLGVVTGSGRGWTRQAIRSASIVLLSLPPLLTSIVLVVFAARTRWLPVSGMRTAGAASSAGDLLWHLIVPAAALGLPIAAMFERLQSQAMSDVIGQPYVIAAMARGVPRARIVWRDALRAALRPAASVYGLVIGTLLSGSFAVETVTAWPGLGQLMLGALRSRDLYLVAGCAAAGGVFLAAGTFVSDVALALIDPRATES